MWEKKLAKESYVQKNNDFRDTLQDRTYLVLKCFSKLINGEGIYTKSHSISTKKMENLAEKLVRNQQDSINNEIIIHTSKIIFMTSYIGHKSMHHTNQGITFTLSDKTLQIVNSL